MNKFARLLWDLLTYFLMCILRWRFLIQFKLSLPQTWEFLTHINIEFDTNMHKHTSRTGITDARSCTWACKMNSVSYKLDIFENNEFSYAIWKDIFFWRMCSGILSCARKFHKVYSTSRVDSFLNKYFYSQSS